MLRFKILLVFSTSIFILGVMFLNIHNLFMNKSITDSQKSRYSLLSKCDDKIAKLDKIFDFRRSVRQKRRFKPRGTKNKFDLFEPEAICISEERFGSSKRYNSFGDGAKWVCGVDIIAAKGKLDNCLVYSVGSANRIEFEIAVHDNMGCEIHTFDPKMKNFIGKRFATFHPWAIGIDGKAIHFKENIDWVGKSIETIMKELGHVGRKLDILKIDCEGCEYNAMPVLFEQMAAGNIIIDQILIEVHETAKFKAIKKLFKDADKAGMRIFHKERNGWGCDGYKCVEYAFVSESFLREVNKAVVC